MKYLFPADTLLRKGRPRGRAGGNIHEESHKNGCIYIIIFNIKCFHRLFGVSALFFVRRKRVVRRVDRKSGHDRAGRCHSAYLAVSISPEDMESYMQDLTIQINLTLEQTDHGEGTFHSSVLPESYDSCNQAAYEAFAMAFQDLLAQRLRMAGYTNSTDREAIEALVEETFGMSTVSYLMSCGPELLPPLEDLQIQYDGRGTYEAIDGILTRQFDASWPVATRVERYIREGSSLILSEANGSAEPGLFLDYYPMLYTLKQPSNQ